MSLTFKTRKEVAIPCIFQSKITLIPIILNSIIILIQIARINKKNKTKTFFKCILSKIKSFHKTFIPKDSMIFKIFNKVSKFRNNDINV